MPGSYVRLSAGRTDMSDAVQALCFLAGANSIFYGDKLLTTPNPGRSHDEQLFTRLGLRPNPRSPLRLPDPRARVTACEPDEHLAAELAALADANRARTRGAKSVARRAGTTRDAGRRPRLPCVLQQRLPWARRSPAGRARR